MKHVALIANDTTVVYHFRKEIIRELLAQGYSVTVIAEILDFQPELESLGCRILHVVTKRHGTNVIQDLYLFGKYCSILRNLKPDIVLTYNIKPNVYAGLACRILKIPYIPNITGLGTPVENPGPLQKLTTFLYRIGIGSASVVLFQNSENEQFFRDRKMLSPRSRVVLLPGSGVNLAHHPAVPYPEEEPVHFLFIARIMREKGIDLYMAAAKRIHRKWPNTVFHICGGCDDGKYVDILRREQKCGTIVYHGQQKDMVPFFEKTHCVIHPSYYPEGMSNVLLEAAASARPIVATDRSGCRETVEHGKTGYLIPVRNEDALVAAVEKFLSLSWEQRRDMGLAGRVKMEKEFDRQIVVQAYLNLIRDTIGSCEKSYGL